MSSFGECSSSLSQVAFQQSADFKKTKLQQWKELRNEKKQEEQKKKKPPFVVGTVINRSKPSPKKMAKKSLPKKAASKKPDIPSDSVESHDDHVITEKRQFGVQHPTLIPGANLATLMQNLNFEETFKNTFSPFTFTGSSLDNT